MLEIQGPGDIIHRDTADILHAFTEHYAALYASRRKGLLDLDPFLGDVALGWLEVSQREFLCAPFELDEVREAIMHTQSGKAAGMDGLPI